MEECAFWYGLAAQNGNPHACFAIGWLYQHGMGVKEDKFLARKWIQKAVWLGHQPAADYLKKHKL
jgi:TPR repeat protein